MDELRNEVKEELKGALWENISKQEKQRMVVLITSWSV